VLVVEVGRRSAQRRLDEVRPVALVLVERERVREILRVDRRSGRDGKLRRRHSPDRDRVGARRGHAAEHDLVDVGVLRVPRAQRRPERERVDGRTAGAHDTGVTGLRSARDHEGSLDGRRRVASLVDPDERRDRAQAHLGARGGGHNPGHDNRQCRHAGAGESPNGRRRHPAGHAGESPNGACRPPAGRAGERRSAIRAVYVKHDGLPWAARAPIGMFPI
jgi:hypothetical protein